MSRSPGTASFTGLSTFDFELDRPDFDALNTLDTGIHGRIDPSVFGNE